MGWWKTFSEKTEYTCINTLKPEFTINDENAKNHKCILIYCNDNLIPLWQAIRGEVMSTLTRPNYPLNYLLSCRDMINNYCYPFGHRFVNRASLERLIINFSWVYNHYFNLCTFHINSHRWGEQSIVKYFNFIFEEIHHIKYLIYIPSEKSIIVS